VADLTYVWTRGDFCYTALLIDADSCRIVGSRVSTSLRTDLELDALEVVIFSRGGGDLDSLVHHSYWGEQYLAIRYTERLKDAGAVDSVGSKGDSFDNALAETVDGLYKAELINRQGPWRSGLPCLSWSRNTGLSCCRPDRRQPWEEGPTHPSSAVASSTCSSRAERSSTSRATWASTSRRSAPGDSRRRECRSWPRSILADLPTGSGDDLGHLPAQRVREPAFQWTRSPSSST